MSEELKINELSDELISVENPNSCSGNACGSISLRSRFHDGTLTIKFMTVQNSSQRAINFKVNWGGVFAPPGSQNSEALIPAFQSVDVYTPVEYITGYYSINATYQ